MLSVVYYHASIILYTHLVSHGIDKIFSLFQILCYNLYLCAQKEYLFIKKKNSCGSIDILSKYSHCSHSLTHWSNLFEKQSLHFHMNYRFLSKFQVDWKRTEYSAFMLIP